MIHELVQAWSWTNFGVWALALPLICYAGHVFDNRRQVALSEIVMWRIRNGDRTLLPLIRMFVPKMIAHDIMGVQNVSADTGSVFKLKTVYNDPDDGIMDALKKAQH